MIRVGKIATAAAVAALCVACASGGAQTAGQRPAAATPITGATPTEVSLIHRLLTKHPAGTIRSVDVTRPPASVLMRDDGTIDKNEFSASDVWIVVTVPAVAVKAADGKAPMYEIPLWKGEIFAAAVETEMKRAAIRTPARGLRTAVGFTVSEVERSGRRVHSETVITPSNSGGDFVTTDAAVRHDVVAQLAADGITRGGHGPVTLQSVSLFEGVDPAPIVELRLRTNSSGEGEPWTNGFDAGPTYEGYLLLVDGPNGAPIELGANIERAAYGSSWADPRYIKDFGDMTAPVHG
ncbi:MAG TPA: hypothetical protein VGI86_14610 [Acidimicrobiia bacterium]